MRDTQNQKEQIRAQARFHRNRLTVSSGLFEQAAEQFERLQLDLKGKILAGYWAKGKEFDVRYIMHSAAAAGAICALPVVEPKSRALQFARWGEGDDLTKGAFDILEPVKKDFLTPDIVLVPLLAFDRRGTRMGQGGGYYDATLAALRAKNSDILAIGVCYADQAVLFNLPVEDHDQRLDMVITPDEVIDFRDSSHHCHSE